MADLDIELGETLSTSSIDNIVDFSKKQLNDFKSETKTPLESQEDIEIVRFLEKSIPVKMLLVDNVSYAVDYLEDITVVENILKGNSDDR